MDIIRWGILGTGRIARAFAQDLQRLPDSSLAAVGAASLEEARQFATALKLPRAYGSYAELAADPEIDIIYIVTPAAFHKEHAFLCLDAGKAVMVEKPFALTAVDARQIADYARSKNLFCMEAMWMRFIPAMQEAVRLLKSGVIGDIYMISASLNLYHEFDPQHPLFDPQRGGGAMLDLGVYPLSLIHQLLGRPSAVSSQAYVGASGVDENTAVLLHFPDGQIASLSAGIRGNGRNDALIMGTRGTLHIHSPLYRPTVLTVEQHESAADSPPVRKLYKKIKRWINGREQLKISCNGHGYGYEAAEAAQCLRENQLESLIISLDDSIAIMETMDAIRRPD